MKKLLYILLTFCSLLFAFAFSFAQQKNQEYKWEIGLQINTPERKSPLEEQTEDTYGPWNDELQLYYGISSNARTKDRTFALSIISNYFKNDDFFRYKAGINKVSIHLLPDVVDTSGYYSSYEASKYRNDFIISLGIGKGITFKQFHLHSGFEIPFTYYGKGNVNFHTKTKVPFSPNYSFYELNGTIFNSYSIGIGGFSGFTFGYKKFSFGGEISFAFLYNKRLGETKFHNETKDYINNNFTTFDFTYNPTISNFDISKVKGSINLTYLF